MKLRKFRDSDSLNAKAAQQAKLERLTEEALPKVPGAITIAGFKAMTLLAYEDRYEPEGAPRTR